MIQDIFPSRLKNEYMHVDMRAEDTLIVFDKEGRIYLGSKGKEIVFPDGNDIKPHRSVYLFSLDERRFFLSLDDISYEKEGFAFYSIREVRECFSGKEVFAVFTAYHLWKWYSDNVFCGKCGERLELYDKERALRCPKCGNIIYPRINPAVIVGVIKGDSILITRYRTGFSHNALVAGFTEIGETFEETVKREVMEETGVKVKNIRYYKSQPWGMAQDILVGYYCDAEEDSEITMDESELKYAEWVKREDIVLQPNNLSLTNEMMKQFKDGVCH
ncbi:Zn-finger containing NTP pyrophosphohydrolase [Lachnospiraceae bacterium JC7]|nr:Zn-finger containing NTP pyrophosphohydrolase [Lachnospiraceae bacterium JC7]